MRLFAAVPGAIVERDADLPPRAIPAGTRSRLARRGARAASRRARCGHVSGLDLRPVRRFVLLPLRGRDAGRRQGRERARRRAVRTDRRRRGDRHRAARTYERRPIMKRTKALVLAIVAAGLVAAAGSATANPRSGILHVTKTCPPSQYQGQAGGFCTITGSNINAIKPGSKVGYASA